MLILIRLALPKNHIILNLIRKLTDLAKMIWTVKYFLIMFLGLRLQPTAQKYERNYQ